MNEMDNKQKHAIMLAQGYHPLVCGEVTLYLTEHEQSDVERMTKDDLLTMTMVVEHAWRMNRMVEND